jgi:hypothetical protein
MFWGEAEDKDEARGSRSRGSPDRAWAVPSRAGVPEAVQTMRGRDEVGA